jgi:hypothetical protein
MVNIYSWLSDHFLFWDTYHAHYKKLEKKTNYLYLLFLFNVTLPNIYTNFLKTTLIPIVMKKINLLFVLFAFVAFISFSACQAKTEKTESTEEVMPEDEQPVIDQDTVQDMTISEDTIM